MFTVKQMAPPAGWKFERTGEFTVGIRLCIVSNDISGYLHPEGNRIGTILLSRLLQAKMELGGARVSQAAGVFEFNYSYHLLGVSELQAGLQAAREALQECGLLEAAQIAWF